MPPDLATYLGTFRRTLEHVVQLLLLPPRSGPGPPLSLCPRSSVRALRCLQLCRHKTGRLLEEARPQRQRPRSTTIPNRFPKRKPLLFAYSHRANRSELCLGTPAVHRHVLATGSLHVYDESATAPWLRDSYERPSDSCPMVLARRANPVSPVPASAEEHHHVVRQCLMPRGASVFTR